MRNIIFISLILFFTACGNSQSGTDKKAELEKLKKEQADLKVKIQSLEAELSASDTTALKSKLVSITEIQPGNFNHFIEVQAKVDGDQDVQLSAETPGNITSVNVNAGDKVSVGQVLANIDDKLIRQNIAELQGQLDLATQMFIRQKNLWDQKIGSEVQLLQAKVQKEGLDSRMEMMKHQLDMTRIKSPINGTVDNVNIKIGQTVAPGYPAIRVVNLSSLKVKAEVAESFISKVKKGNEVLLFFPDENIEVKAKIDYSGSRIDPVNRTFNVEVRLTDKNENFHPNMVVMMKIVDYSNNKAFVVPVGAVQKSTEGEFVYVLDNEGNKTIAKRKTVKSGMIYNGFTEIRSGLDAGDKVITNGFQNVIEGDAIKI